MSFERACLLVLEEEGVLNEHAADDGGVTKYGISLAFLKRVGVDMTGDGIVNEDDVRALTREQSVELYREHFWRRVGLEGLPRWASLPLFDGAVNHGPGLAVRMFQAALVEDTGLALSIDGSLGKATEGAIHAANARDTLALYYRRRLEIYLQHDDWTTFGRGWTGRAHSIWTAALT